MSHYQHPISIKSSVKYHKESFSPTPPTEIPWQERFKIWLRQQAQKWAEDNIIKKITWKVVKDAWSYITGFLGIAWIATKALFQLIFQYSTTRKKTPKSFFTSKETWKQFFRSVLGTNILKSVTAFLFKTVVFISLVLVLPHMLSLIFVCNFDSSKAYSVVQDFFSPARFYPIECFVLIPAVMLVIHYLIQFFFFFKSSREERDNLLSTTIKFFKYSLPHWWKTTKTSRRIIFIVECILFLCSGLVVYASVSLRVISKKSFATIMFLVSSLPMLLILFFYYLYSGLSTILVERKIQTPEEKLLSLDFTQLGQQAVLNLTPPPQTGYNSPPAHQGGAARPQSQPVPTPAKPFAQNEIEILKGFITSLFQKVKEDLNTNNMWANKTLQRILKTFFQQKFDIGINTLNLDTQNNAQLQLMLKWLFVFYLRVLLAKDADVDRSLQNLSQWVQQNVSNYEKRGTIKNIILSENVLHYPILEHSLIYIFGDQHQQLSFFNLNPTIKSSTYFQVHWTTSDDDRKIHDFNLEINQRLEQLEAVDGNYFTNSRIVVQYAKTWNENVHSFLYFFFLGSVVSSGVYCILSLENYWNIPTVVVLSILSLISIIDRKNTKARILIRLVCLLVAVVAVVVSFFYSTTWLTDKTWIGFFVLYLLFSGFGIEIFVKDKNLKEKMIIAMHLLFSGLVYFFIYRPLFEYFLSTNQKGAISYATFLNLVMFSPDFYDITYYVLNISGDVTGRQSVGPRADTEGFGGSKGRSKPLFSSPKK